MKSYAIYNITTGQILYIHRTEVEPPDITLGDGESYEEVPFTVFGNTHYMNESREPVVIPTKPKESYWTWSWTAKDWVDSRSLEQHKDDKWQSIKLTRYAKLSEPLSTPYGTFDADQDSQQNIYHSLQYLQENGSTTTTVVFTLNDNSTATFTSVELSDVVVLLGERSEDIYATSRTLRTNIYAATTSTDVESITWPI